MVKRNMKSGSCESLNRRADPGQVAFCRCGPAQSMQTGMRLPSFAAGIFTHLQRNCWQLKTPRVVTRRRLTPAGSAPILGLPREEDHQLEAAEPQGEGMLTPRVVIVWIGILSLSCMFLIGQDTWPPTCPDADGDGYGDPGSGLCTYPGRDCDDGDPSVNPGAPEGSPATMIIFIV